MKAGFCYAAILAGAMCLAAKIVPAEENSPTVPKSAAATTTRAAEPATWRASEHVLSKVIPGWQGEFRISPDGRHVAYHSGVGVFKSEEQYEGSDGWMEHAVVVDGKIGKHYNFVNEYRFSPDSKHIAYSASNSEESVVVMDNHELKRYAAAETDTSVGIDVQFSPDSRRIAYIVPGRKGAASSYVVVNGKKGKSYPNITELHFSPDSQRVAYLVENNSLVKDSRFPVGRSIVVDELEGKVYDWVQNTMPIFSPDSKRMAYFARNEQPRKAFVVVDGQEEGKQFTGVNDTSVLTFSPDSQHLLYVTYEKDGLSVVVDGQRGKSHVAWGIFEPTFSSDSKRSAYIVKTHVKGGEVFVVTNGQECKRFGGKEELWVHYLTFSPDSKRVAYAVTLDKDHFVVADDKEGRRYKNVGWITFSPDGSRVAYVAEARDAKVFVVIDGNEGRQFDGAGDLVFSPDGKKVAYAAYSKKDKKWRIVINEHVGNPYDSILTRDYKNPAGSLRFDSNDRFHYLAMSKKRILLVEEEPGISGSYRAAQSSR